MEVAESEQVYEDGLPASLPSGAEMKVLTEAELRYVERRVQQYHDSFKWTNVSDIQDVDRIVILELLVYRYGLFIGLQKDYMGDPVDENALRKSIADYSGELRQLKRSLGMDKASRDKERGEDSVANYLEQLRVRAREFGVTRDGMHAKGIELGMHLIALWQLYANCTEDERAEQNCTAEDIMRWVGEVYKPQFEAVDAAFRRNQRMWITRQ